VQYNDNANVKKSTIKYTPMMLIKGFHLYYHKGWKSHSNLCFEHNKIWYPTRSQTGSIHSGLIRYQSIVSIKALLIFIAKLRNCKSFWQTCSSLILTKRWKSDDKSAIFNSAEFTLARQHLSSHQIIYSFDTCCRQNLTETRSDIFFNHFSAFIN
jgi:hypothetical protein